MEFSAEIVTYVTLYGHANSREEFEAKVRALGTFDVSVSAGDNLDGMELSPVGTAYGDHSGSDPVALSVNEV